jgi:hypothetical protein
VGVISGAGATLDHGRQKPGRLSPEVFGLQTKLTDPQAVKL